MAIDLYAMTANNVTYAVFGKPLGLFGNDQGYWDFFAERDAAGASAGLGLCDRHAAARMTASRLARRFTAISRWRAMRCCIRAGSAPHGFIDVTPRRTTLPVIYNQYQRIDALGDYRAQDHDYWPVFRPLFLTGWLIADQLEDERDYGARKFWSPARRARPRSAWRMRCSSASTRPQIVGLTSAGNAAYVEALGLYDRVVTYDAIGAMDAGVASAMVDMAGNPQVAASVHNHFGDALEGIDRRRQIALGFGRQDATPMAGPPRQMFFAPGRSEKRIGEWGPDGFRAEAGGGVDRLCRSRPAHADDRQTPGRRCGAGRVSGNGGRQGRCEGGAGHRSMSFSAVIFDFGGVITSSPFEAFNRLEAARGLPQRQHPPDQRHQPGYQRLGPVRTGRDRCRGVRCGLRVGSAGAWAGT